MQKEALWTSLTRATQEKYNPYTFSSNFLENYILRNCSAVLYLWVLWECVSAVCIFKLKLHTDSSYWMFQKQSYYQTNKACTLILHKTKYSIVLEVNKLQTSSDNCKDARWTLQHLFLGILRSHLFDYATHSKWHRVLINLTSQLLFFVLFSQEHVAIMGESGLFYQEHFKDFQTRWRFGLHAGHF